tara:strand:+ start:175 stop:549 length:375 start_codon:yes stop_codon:yes gene_type:complete
MKLVLNNIDDISLSDIHVYRDIIFYSINDINLIGLYFVYQKKMLPKDNRYIIYFEREAQIKKLNDYFSRNYRPFLKDKLLPSIEVIKNKATEVIFNDKEQKLVINFKSINDNNYPKIHILPWNV